MFKQVSVGTLKLNPVTKTALISEIKERISTGKKTFLTTLYSEFLYHSLRDKEIKAILDKADIAIADGIGILWADYFLNRSFSFTNYYLKIIQAWWQVVYTGASILVYPKNLYRTFPEKIVGADLFWDLAKMAEQENFSLYLVGWHDQKTEKVVEVLKARYPKLNIVGFANTTPDDTKVVQEIQSLAPDMVFVAFGPMKQERWIVNHLPELPVKFAVGLGGSFDYAIGKKVAPPKLVRSIGLEWLYRLLTQPQRVVRIYQAVWGLILSLVRYKVFMSLPLRQNVSIVVLNSEKKVLLCKRIPAPPKNKSSKIILDNYWQFPQGGLDEGEDMIEGGKRELYEETNIQSVEILGLSTFDNSYLWNNATRSLIGNTRRNKGQIQRTLFVKFLADDSEIILDNVEFKEFEWLTFPEASERIADERRAYAGVVLEELQELLVNKTKK